MDSIRGQADVQGLPAESTGFVRRIVPRLSLTPDECAESTGFSRTRIFQAIRAHELCARKDGKATVVEVTELQRWLRTLPTRGKQPEVSTA
jgi:hypothetical protein